MKPYAERFYKSAAWKACRRSYAKAAGGLCERCKSKGIITAGIIVHHKIHITEDNINDPDVVLSWDNLELVCRDCHAQEHGRLQRRYSVDDMGRIVART